MVHRALLACADAIDARRDSTGAIPPNARPAVERLRIARLRLEEAAILCNLSIE